MENDTSVEWTYEVPGKALMAFVKELNTIECDAKFVLLENGIAVNVVDPSHVSMSTVTLGGGKPIGLSYGMELRNLKDSLAGHTKMNSKETSMVTMSCDGEIMYVDLQDGTKFSWRGLDLSTLTPPTLPELDLPASISVTGQQFALGIQRQRRIGDLTRIMITKDKLELSVTGSTSRVVTTISGAGKIKDKTESVKGNYSLTYLVGLAKEWKNADTVTLGLGENYPLLASKVNEVGGVEINSKFFLAPRTDNDY